MNPEKDEARRATILGGPQINTTSQFKPSNPDRRDSCGQCYIYATFVGSPG